MVGAVAGRGTAAEDAKPVFARRIPGRVSVEHDGPGRAAGVGKRGYVRGETVRGGDAVAPPAVGAGTEDDVAVDNDLVGVGVGVGGGGVGRHRLLRQRGNPGEEVGVAAVAQVLQAEGCLVRRAGGEGGNGRKLLEEAAGHASGACLAGMVQSTLTKIDVVFLGLVDGLLPRFP